MRRTLWGFVGLGLISVLPEVALAQTGDDWELGPPPAPPPPDTSDAADAGAPTGDDAAADPGEVDAGPAQSEASELEPAPAPPAAGPPAPSAPPTPAWVGPPPNYFPLVLQPPELAPRLELSIDRRTPAFAVCSAPCTVMVPPGEYWLEISETEKTVAGHRRFEVRQPSRAVIVPRSKSRVDTGLVMGVGGIGMIVGGIALAIAGAESSSDSFGNGEDSMVFLGILTMIGGMVITPIGWVHFAQRNPAVDVEPLE